MLSTFDLFYIAYTLFTLAFPELRISIEILQIRGLKFLFYVFFQEI